MICLFFCQSPPCPSPFFPFLCVFNSRYGAFDFNGFKSHGGTTVHDFMRFPPMHNTRSIVGIFRFGRDAKKRALTRGLACRVSCL